MTPIRIDRCLQSTYLFFKDECPVVSAHSVARSFELGLGSCRYHTDMLASVGSAS
jgi:hypothetical protein